MLSRTIKYSFAIIGFVSVFIWVGSFLPDAGLEGVMRPVPKYLALTVVSGFFGILFYFISGRIITTVTAAAQKIELFYQNMSLYEIAISTCGLATGLVIANLIIIPVNTLSLAGIPVFLFVNVFFGTMGMRIALKKKDELVFEIPASRDLVRKGNGRMIPKILDTSVIIDGRIVDICKSGFIEGTLIIPTFILEELRHIADSSDSLKRNRGRRGLDVLSIIQKELNMPVEICDIKIDDECEVDIKLLKVAKKFQAAVLTNDFNLNKVANVHGVPVLNINELANSVKPVVLPGEEMTVTVIKDGKENGQGIGYLDDGTMIVIEGGRKHIGESLIVVVTSVLQTAAGRMIFAKPRYVMERAV